MHSVDSFGHEHSISHLLDLSIPHALFIIQFIISLSYTHSVLVLSMTPLFDLSGKTAAI